METPLSESKPPYQVPTPFVASTITSLSSHRPLPLYLRRVSHIFSTFCPTKQPTMGESNAKSKIDSTREWIVEHKLRSVGNFSFSLLCIPISLYGFRHLMKFLIFCADSIRMLVVEWDCWINRLQLVSAGHENQRQDHSR